MRVGVCTAVVIYLASHVMRMRCGCDFVHMPSHRKRRDRADDDEDEQVEMTDGSDYQRWDKTSEMQDELQGDKHEDISTNSGSAAAGPTAVKKTKSVTNVAPALALFDKVGTLEHKRDNFLDTLMLIAKSALAAQALTHFECAVLLGVPRGDFKSKATQQFERLMLTTPFHTLAQRFLRGEFRNDVPGIT